jgi:ribosomal protein S18 acetylase RimI-like enzyme
MKPKLYGTDRLDEHTGGGSAALIGDVWPDFAGLFRREMTVYQAHGDVFEPYFALAETAGKIVGFSLLMESMMTTDLLTMTWVAVHPEHRRQGIGRDLI